MRHTVCQTETERVYLRSKRTEYTNVRFSRKPGDFERKRNEAKRNIRVALVSSSHSVREGFSQVSCIFDTIEMLHYIKRVMAELLS